eukprot:3797199-Rhodomonas_salina.1
MSKGVCATHSYYGSLTYLASNEQMLSYDLCQWHYTSVILKHSLLWPRSVSKTSRLAKSFLTLLVSTGSQGSPFLHFNHFVD